MELPPRIVADLSDEINKALGNPGVQSRARSPQTVICKYFDKKTQEPLKNMACKKGCFYCCCVPVSTWPIEIFSIAEYVRAQSTHKVLGNRERFTERLRKAAAEGEDLRWEKRKLCPFLFDGCCSIYPVRPITCRGWMMPKASYCRKAFGGDNSNVPYPEVPIAFQAVCNGAIALTGMHTGLDMRLFRFLDAMAHVLGDGITEEVFFDGGSPFVGVPEDVAMPTKDKVLEHATVASKFIFARGIE